MTDVDDVLGPAPKKRQRRPRPTPPPLKRRPGRPRKHPLPAPHPPLPKAPARESTLSGGPQEQSVATAPPAATVLSGVSVTWLAKAFRMKPSTVRTKLSDAPHIGRRTSGCLYSLPVAARYLVDPVLSVEAYLDEIDPEDLPNKLQSAFWDARLKRQKWEREAGDLWHSDDVVTLLGEVFKSIKYTLQLWPDTIDREGTVSDEQRDTLVRLCDELALELLGSLLRLTEERTVKAARPYIDKLEQRLGGEAGPDVEDVI